jgi:hypothetical protein
MMKKTCLIAITLISTLFIFSCSVELSDYENSNRDFDIKEYFSGDIIAWGVVQDYNKKVNRRFCVEIKGTWQENKGLLAEKFYFFDGEISYRNWQLTKQMDGGYTGEAEDVVGEAIGKHQDFAFQFQYELLLKVDDETYQVSMDDWMYQLDQHRVINKTAISKFGVNVANITIFFDKENQTKTCLLDKTLTS